MASHAAYFFFCFSFIVLFSQVNSQSKVNKVKVWDTDECGFKALMQADLTFNLGYAQGKNLDILIDFGMKEVGFSFLKPSTCIVTPLNQTNFPSSANKFEFAIADLSFQRTAGPKQTFTTYVVSPGQKVDANQHFALPTSQRLIKSDLVIEHCMDSKTVYIGSIAKGPCQDDGNCIMKDVICHQ